MCLGCLVSLKHISRIGRVVTWVKEGSSGVSFLDISIPICTRLLVSLICKSDFHRFDFRTKRLESVIYHDFALEI